MTTTNNTQANNTADITDVSPKGERGFIGRQWDRIPTTVKWVAGAAVVGGVGYIAYKHFTKDAVASIANAAGSIAAAVPDAIVGVETLPAVSAAAAEALNAFA